MIGEPPRTYTMPANVVFLGPKPNTDLPAYLANATRQSYRSSRAPSPMPYRR